MPWRASNWKGLDVVARKDRASARALISMAMYTSVSTKQITHKISGTLARSVHAAPVGYSPNETSEEASAENGDMLDMGMTVEIVEHVPGAALVEVGSWLPYACAEWVGRGHPGVTQGLELARPRFDEIVLLAFKEEGL